MHMILDKKIYSANQRITESIARYGKVALWFSGGGQT